MAGKPVVLLPLAEQDVDEATRHYRSEGGASLALRWVRAVAAALRHVGAHSAGGSARYATQLNLAGLRVWPVKKFPYLIFYLERAAQVDVWRVLQAQRDIPAWLQDDEQGW